MAALLAGACLVVAVPVAASPPKPLGGCEQEFKRVVDGVRPSVVTVIAYSKIGDLEANSAKTLKKSIGSGVVINTEGHILTTLGVIGSSRNLFVRTHDGVERPAVFLGADHATGLALLKVKPDGLAPAQLGKPQDLQPGAWAIIVAESFGQYPNYAFGAFTRIVAGSGRGGLEPSILQMTTQVYPGNSGGAVANASGEVVGVVLGAMSGGRAGSGDGGDGARLTDVPEPTPGRGNLPGIAASETAPAGLALSPSDGLSRPSDRSPTSAALEPAPLGSGGSASSDQVGPTLSLAIPIDRAGQVAADLATHGSSGPGFLGVRVRTSTPALKDLLNFENGVVILEVIAMSPAETAGIEPGDVILKFGGQPVPEPSELAHLVADVRPGERRDVELLRGDVHLTRTVTIGSSPIGNDNDRRAAEADRERLKQRVDELKKELELLEGRLQAR